MTTPSQSFPDLPEASQAEAMKVVDCVEHVRSTAEYRAIVEFYGDRCAARSLVPLINHIHEGLVVLDEINASLHAMRAWCLHPLFQADTDLAQTVHRLGPFWAFDPHCVLLAMEYRYRANAWLSDKVRRTTHGLQHIVHDGVPCPGDLEEVWHMLIADKVQNCKDFQAHHKGTHPRSVELDHYFKEWLRALDVEADEFSALCAALDTSRALAQKEEK